MTIDTLLKRLHEANFVQGSFYERNILVQPGPLDRPSNRRSLDKPSYRIVDFGRGVSLGVNCWSVENMRKEVRQERREAHSGQLIP